ncbi:MAG: hypothetical protein WC869_07360 [Phycisphaerae bacterium]|jgi:hypothetical protein
MYRYAFLMLAVAGAVFAGGCSADLSQYPGRSLGMVHYGDAVDVARQVMGQYYSVAEVDADAGVIKSMPKRTEMALAGGPAREIATVYLRKRGDEVVVNCSVIVQTSAGPDGSRLNPTRTSYSGVPNQTPSEMEAATTPKQNDAWVEQRQNTSMANKILNDIYAALHKSQPGDDAGADHLKPSEKWPAP